MSLTYGYSSGIRGCGNLIAVACKIFKKGGLTTHRELKLPHEERPFHDPGLSSSGEVFCFKKPTPSFDVCGSVVDFYFLSIAEPECCLVGSFNWILYWTFLEYAVHRWGYHSAYKSKMVYYFLGSFHLYHHMHHHDKAPNKNFGNTSHLWDVLLGTFDPQYVIYEMSAKTEDTLITSNAVLNAQIRR